MSRVLRTCLGAALLLSAFALVPVWLGGTAPWSLLLAASLAWALSVFCTQKYVHKYPRRRLSYLLASHGKAAVTLAFLLGGAALALGPETAPPRLLLAAFAAFTLADGLVSLLWTPGPQAAAPAAPPAPPSPPEAVPAGAPPGASPADEVSPGGSFAGLGQEVQEFLRANLPGAEALRGVAAAPEGAGGAAGGEGPACDLLVAGAFPLNDVRRLSRFLSACAARLPEGGHFVARYEPLEAGKARLRRRFPGPLYGPAALLHFLWFRAFPKVPYANGLYFFLTRGRGRVLSKTEVWGRLESCGLRAIAESSGEGERLLLARRVPAPPQVKRPSYYPIIALERVSLDGRIILAHKVRTMYPFSEYIQKRVFELNSMGATGKAADDFRITEYGRFLRKYWLDEIPQIWDWWRGDIKLVGLRAMSRHYYSLYPREVQELYLQVKPGLIPPIFGESTQGFEQIVAVDAQYLRRYLAAPVRTDLRYFFQTFYDIVFRGVRSH